MRKMMTLLLVLMLVFLSSNSVSAAQANDSMKGNEWGFNFTVFLSNGEPAKGADVYLIDSDIGQTIYSGKTNHNGNVSMSLYDHYVQTMNIIQNQLYVDKNYKVVIFTLSGEIFMQNIPRTIANLTELQKNSIDENLLEDNVQAFEFVTIKPPNDDEELYRRQEVGVMGGSEAPTRYAIEELGTRWVNIDRVYTTTSGNIRVQFAYQLQKASDIQVATNFSGNWTSYGGHIRIRNENHHNLQWDGVNNGVPMCYTPQTEYRFRKEYWRADYYGLGPIFWEEIKAYALIGGTRAIYYPWVLGNEMPWQDVINWQHGNRVIYHSNISTMPLARSTVNGTEFGGALTINGVTLNIKTRYDSRISHTYFTPNRNGFIVYDKFSNWAFWYMTDYPH